MIPTASSPPPTTSARRRPVGLLVLSDVHLGSEACRAQELLDYLESIEPQEVMLLGDIIDFWAYDGWWPDTHHRVLRRLSQFARDGIKVTYIPGNHDANLRSLAPCSFAGMDVALEVERDIAGVRTLFFHGDVVDDQLALPRWMSAPATLIYDSLMSGQDLINRVRRWSGLPRAGFIQRALASLPMVRKHIRHYEQACAERARERGCAGVVVGHIHAACIGERAGIAYANSGDWVESLTALEFDGSRWQLASAAAPAAAPALPAQPELAAVLEPVAAG
jgi:UDP-2,3-diacylglucosamine pyrophosphatase LpxH